MQAYHPYQLNFWRYYLIQMRPYLLFVSGAAGLMGMAIGFERYPDVSPLRLLLAFPPFFLAYGFGQALTDCFQTDTDQISAPERPLSKGLLRRKAVMSISLTGLALSAGVLIWLHPLNLLLGLLSVAGLATYTYIKRRFWWGGPPYNAWIVTLLPAMGYCIAAPGIAGLPLPLLAMTFISYANFVLMGYLKDIPADAATGYRTFPVVFGWRATVRTGHLLASGAVGAFVPFLSKAGTAAWATWLLACAFALAGQWHASRVKSEDQAASLFGITCTVRTFLLLQWAAILAFQPGWVLTGILYYSLFEAVLYFRYEHNQV
jgi:geranylgeranylglycerol-phosphate geranylgeranyltransferase